MASTMLQSPSSTSVAERSSVRLSTPQPMVALPWGSRSISSTRRCVAASEAARFTAVVVLPTPPFWFATAMMRFIMPGLNPSKFDDAALGVESGDGDRVDRERFPARRKGFQLVLRHLALHREQPPAPPGQVPGHPDELGERAEGPRDDRIEGPRRPVGLGTAEHRLHVRQVEL